MQPAELKRVPLTGGASETILSVSRLEWWECARIPEGPCLLAERSNDRKQAIVTEFDPEKGRGAEVTRIAFDPKVESWVAALSPEGKRLAVIRSPGSPLEILSLKGKQLNQIIVPEFTHPSRPSLLRVAGLSNFGPLGPLTEIREKKMPKSHGHSWSKNPVPDCSETATEKSVKSFRLITSECFAVRAEFALTAALSCGPDPSITRRLGEHRRWSQNGHKTVATSTR